MYPNDPFRQPNYERIPRFPSQIDRQGERRPPREFPGRSLSTQVDRFTPREQQIPRKAPNLSLHPMSKAELSPKQNELILLSLPTDFEQDPDDPLTEIINLQSNISDQLLNVISKSCSATEQGISSIKSCPHCSKAYKDGEEIAYDLEGRYRYVDKIQDGSAASLEELLYLKFISKNHCLFLFQIIIKIDHITS